MVVLLINNPHSTKFIAGKKIDSYFIIPIEVTIETKRIKEKVECHSPHAQ